MTHESCHVSLEWILGTQIGLYGIMLRSALARGEPAAQWWIACNAVTIDEEPGFRVVILPLTRLN